MTHCHQSDICSEYLPTVRRALDQIEVGMEERPRAVRGNDCSVGNTCGPLWWGVLHAAVDAIDCEKCRNEAVHLMRGLHDAINQQLQRPLQYPEDMTLLHQKTAALNGPIALAECSAKEYGMVQRCSQENPAAKALCAVSVGCHLEGP